VAAAIGADDADIDKLSLGQMQRLFELMGLNAKQQQGEGGDASDPTKTDES
jgi:hypothetical protein